MTILPTELVGSYAIPSWLWIVRERIEQHGDLGKADIEETLNDAVSVAVADQERAGLNVITDGEMARIDFIQSFYGRLIGLERQDPLRRFGAAGYDQNPSYTVVGPVAAPNGLGIVEELDRLKAITTLPTKICVPGPMTLALPLVLANDYETRDELYEIFTAIVNTEMKALVTAGAQYIQVDEPRYPSSNKEAAHLVERFNRTRDGVEARVGLHLCFGNYKGRARDRRDYSTLFPALLDADADQFNLEFANREFTQIDLLSHFESRRGVVGVGVLDVKSYYVETAENVADAIRLALRYTSPENVVITPDCGLNHCPRSIAARKLLAMVDGAEIVRKELTG